MKNSPHAWIFDIKRDSSEDGPGIRTTVFFKGCPLSCVWCQNPESASAKPGLSFDSQRCHPSLCDAACIKACPHHSISLDLNQEIHINRDKCARCDACISSCDFNALERVGYRIELDNLLQRVLIDAPFFNGSGGGVTLSGGEPTVQMKFIHKFLSALKQRGIHTAIETCGYFDYGEFSAKVLPYLDLIYYDLKLFDVEASKKYVGKSNEIILSNFNRLAKESNIKLVPRIPLIPNITTSDANLQSWAQFLRQAGIDHCELLPFNPLFHDKLEKLGLSSKFHYPHFMNLQEQQACVNQFYHSTNE